MHRNAFAFCVRLRSLTVRLRSPYDPLRSFFAFTNTLKQQHTYLVCNNNDWAHILSFLNPLRVKFEIQNLQMSNETNPNLWDVSVRMLLSRKSRFFKITVDSLIFDIK